MKTLNKIYNEPSDYIFGVCNKFIRNLIDHFFKILDEKNASLDNGSVFTVLKENAILIKHFAPMCIDFDLYPPYSDVISELFKTNINAHIHCYHSYSY